MEREYLGDGVYASFDGYQIWLSLQSGETIALEPGVFNRLVEYRDRTYASVQAAALEVEERQGLPRQDDMGVSE